jgi:hypothetical protein
MPFLLDLGWQNTSGAMFATLDGQWHNDLQLPTMKLRLID